MVPKWTVGLLILSHFFIDCLNLCFTFNFCAFADVVQDGKDHYVINAKYIRDVGMDIAMEVLGNVFVTQIGVAFYVIKVSTEVLVVFFR